MSFLLKATAYGDLDHPPLSHPQLLACSSLIREETTLHSAEAEKRPRAQPDFVSCFKPVW